MNAGRAAFDEPRLRALLGLSVPLRARGRSRAQWSGSAAARYRGVGGEFRELREYRPGDPPTRLDWRASARTGRWLIREYERTAQLRVVLLVDGSPTLQYPSGRADAKCVVAATIAAAAGVLALRQGHALAFWDAHGLARAVSGRAVEMALLRSLAMPPPALPHDLAPLARRADMVWVISDFYAAAAPGWLADLRSAAARGTDVRALQVVHADEQDFALRHPTQFADLQNPAMSRTLDPSAARAAYLRAYEEHAERLRESAYASGIALAVQRCERDWAHGVNFLLSGISA